MASSGATPIGYDDRGTGPALVLLHPFPLTRTTWAGLADALAAHRRVIAVDARGFGDSPLAGPFAIADIADDLAALLDRLAIARATVLGMSMGGYAALAFAARHRERLSALVLADTRAAADSAEARAGRAAALATLADAGPAAYLAASLPRLLSPHAPPALVAHVRAPRRDPRRQPARRHRSAARPPRPIRRAGRDRLPDAGRVRHRGPGDARRRDEADRRRDRGRALRPDRRRRPPVPRRGARRVPARRDGVRRHSRRRRGPS